MTDTDKWQIAVEALPEITPELLDILDERYASPPEPTECRVCGGPMAIGEMGAGGTKWRCEAAARGMLAPYDREVMEHYRQSMVNQTRTGDPLVRALVAAFRAREVRDVEDACSGSTSPGDSPS